MTLIVLAPTTTAKARSRGLLRGYRRPFACGALVTSMLLASYSSNGAAPQPSAGAVTTPQRAGHNPSYYVEFGKRYYIRESSEGYRERGVASWYGGDFHGRKTSSGERYDMHAMTAAHPTLPIPTWVEVTNLGNGKHVIVKINDRGPFVDQRLIDLSHAAASALDMVRTGTARVEVRAVDAPPEATARNRGHPSASSTSASSTSASTTAASRTSPSSTSASSVSASRASARAAERVAADEPSHRRSPLTPQSRTDSPRAAAEPPTPLTQSERLFAQAGKFSERANAVELVETLKAQGFVNAFIVTEDGRRKSMHRVRVGPLLDETEVERVSEQLRGLGAKRSQLVVMR